MLPSKSVLSVSRSDIGFPRLDIGVTSRYTLLCVWLRIQKKTKAIDGVKLAFLAPEYMVWPSPSCP